MDKLVSSDAARDSQQDGVLRLGFWLHLNRHLCWYCFQFGLFFHRRLLLLVLDLHRLIEVHPIEFQSIIHWETCYHERVRSRNGEIAKKIPPLRLSSLPSSSSGSSTFCFSTGGASEGGGRWADALGVCSEGGGLITLAFNPAADGDSCFYRRSTQNVKKNIQSCVWIILYV